VTGPDDRVSLDLGGTPDGRADVEPAATISGGGPSHVVGHGPPVGGPGVGRTRPRWVGGVGGNDGNAASPSPSGEGLGEQGPRRPSGHQPLRLATGAQFATHEIVDVCVVLSAAEAALAAAGCRGEAAALTEIFELMESRLLV
jgi:hypothetical protein